MPRFESSAIWRAEYGEELRELRLWFSGDAAPYSYRDVPEDIYFALCDAESKGRFFAEAIRDRFETIPP